MISAEAVVWGYRVILGRDPESEAVVREKMRACAVPEDLRDTLLASDEYTKSIGGKPGETNIVIKPMGHLRLFVDISDKVVGWAIVRDEYEVEELKFVRKTVKKDWNVIDLGANYGYFTVHMADCVGPGGSVLALEPLAHIRSLLERSIRESDFRNVEIRPEAASDRAGTAKLIYAPVTINQGGAFLASENAEVPANHNGDLVPTVRLSEIVRERPVHFIKIDIEGAEPLALRGCLDIIREDMPIILCEIHDAQLRTVSGTSAEEFISWMRSLGYECKAFVPGGLMGIHGHELIGRVSNVVFRT